MPNPAGRKFPIRRRYPFRALALPLLATLLLAGSAFFLRSSANDQRGRLAALFLPERITLEQLEQRYRAKQLTVLVVPGHDRESPGTSFGDLLEVDLNLALAERLRDFFAGDSYFRVFLSQDRTGYASWLRDRSPTRADTIRSFRDRLRGAMRLAVQSGFEQKSTVFHPTAEPGVASRLYALNLWANENAVDLVIHIHFNDYPGRRRHQPGRYSGFSIYVPERQLPNARASLAVAREVLAKLASVLPVSNLPQEADGIIEDQELIAVGANASLDPAAILIEYGYIYEPQWRNPGVRDEVLRELAYQTYAGVAGYFDPNRRLTPHDTALLPHRWDRPLASDSWGERDVLALQAALLREGLYPPVPRDLRSCPLSGTFLECTKTAVLRFQERYRGEVLSPAGLNAPNGSAGPLTIKKLNVLYGSARD